MEIIRKPQGCTNLKLRQLTRMVTRHYDSYVAATGLKNTQYALLSHVVRLGPIRPGDLAKSMQMDASTLTRNTQSLVAHGWIEIQPGRDARSRVVVSTLAGREKQAEGQQAWKKAQDALNDKLGLEAVVNLHEMLDAGIHCLDDDENSED